MTGPYKEISVRLQRDAFNTPWGFRLQGGKDFNAPLAVQRVFVGTPAEAELQRGDVLLNIENYDCRQMMHKQAMDIIKKSGGSLSITLKRGPRSNAPLPLSVSAPKPVHADPNSYRGAPLGQQGAVGTLGFIPKPTRPAMAAQPKVQTFGHDYSQYRPAAKSAAQRRPNQQGPTYPNSMLNRLNTSLNDAIWMPGQGPDDYPGYAAPDYAAPDYGESQGYAPSYQPSFGGSSQPSGQPSNRIWQRPDPYAHGSGGMADPGWAPGMGTQSTNAVARGWAPVKPSQPQLYMEPRQVPVPINARRPQPRDIRHMEPEMPAWKGSLRSSGAPQTWEVQAAALQIDPEYAACMQQEGSGMVQPHQPRVQNMHYQPGQAAVYSQTTPVSQPPAAGGGGDEDSAQVVHLQYNSPMGLYSRQNVDETLRGQTAGGPGAGSMQVTGGHHIGPDGKPVNVDYTQSETYRLIQQEEARARARPQQHRQQQQQPQQQHYQQPPAESARYVEQSGPEMQYSGYQDHFKQSPSMHALEAHVGDISLESQEGGCSDF